METAAMMSLRRNLLRVLNTSSQNKRTLMRSSPCMQEKEEKKSKKFEINVKDLIEDDPKDVKITKPLTTMTLDDHIKKVQEERKKQHRGKLETKELNMIEKFVLVRIGRFQNLDEVPDKIKYSSQEEMDRDKEITMTLLKENGFKIFTGLNYVLWIFTFIFGGTLFYTHFKNKKEQKQMEEEQAIVVQQ